MWNPLSWVMEVALANGGGKLLNGKILLRSRFAMKNRTILGEMERFSKDESVGIRMRGGR
ncbi:hypothetical protein CIPAW_02G037600 [Carya illinoinensis]|uniref:Uncharacterized protein n=1 Tax=Carya illinoinensis TaxID=32201 RepID=A0A8T1RBZ6_CARIL|nr:hypothetical protein CIPAW_02G037600 [Carya illinoinensis]